MEAYITENENALNAYRLLEDGFTVLGYSEPVTDTNGDLYEYIGQYNDNDIVVEYNGQELQLIQGFYYYAFIPLAEIVKADIISAITQSATDTMDLTLYLNGVTLYAEGVPYFVIMQSPESKAETIKAGYLHLPLEYYFD